MRRNRWAWMFAIVGWAVASACGESDPTGGDDPSPQVALFVGDWTATTFTVTSVANDTVSVEVLDNGSFSINVQPSGRYTATLVFLGVPIVETGSLTASESAVTLRPSGGSAATSAYEFAGPDALTLDGPTEFDFNLDGTAESATAHIELERAGS